MRDPDKSGYFIPSKLLSQTVEVGFGEFCEVFIVPVTIYSVDWLQMLSSVLQSVALSDRVRKRCY